MREQLHPAGTVSSNEPEPTDRQTQGPAQPGLEILYARPGGEESWSDVAERDLTKELRERYWIQRGADAGNKAKSWASFEVQMQWSIERAELARNRNEPGDGFRYVFRSGSRGTEGQGEWFEVTEVFESVHPREVERFMRRENGVEGEPGFDPDEFLRGLRMCIPRRAAQRRAADGVIAAVERKLAKPSYAGMSRKHGYGTLIVGLPLWFATLPLDPVRPENAVDDFTTRVQIGLKAHARQLRRRSCPFWRIVVVWNCSAESLREWKRRARLEVYKDPSNRKIGSLPIRGGSFDLVMLDLLEKSTRTGADHNGSTGLTMHIAVAHSKKREPTQNLRLPPAVAEVRRHLEKSAKSLRGSVWERIRLRSGQRFLEVICFVRTHGIGGLERWVIARLSPRRRVARLAMRRRAFRLYRSSLRRQRTERLSANGNNGRGQRSA